MVAGLAAAAVVLVTVRTDAEVAAAAVTALPRQMAAMMRRTAWAVMWRFMAISASVCLIACFAVNCR